MIPLPLGELESGTTQENPKKSVRKSRFQDSLFFPLSLTALSGSVHIESFTEAGIDRMVELLLVWNVRFAAEAVEANRWVWRKSDDGRELMQADSDRIEALRAVLLRRACGRSESAAGLSMVVV